MSENTVSLVASFVAIALALFALWRTRLASPQWHALESPLRFIVNALDPETRLALEAAAGFAHSQGHNTVEIEHWIAKLVENAGAELRDLMRYFEINPEAMKREFFEATETFPRGERIPSLSAPLVRLLDAAWAAATVELKRSTVGAVHVVYSLLKYDEFADRLRAESIEFNKMSLDSFQEWSCRHASQNKTTL